MKKLLITLFVLTFGLSAFAGEREDALKFFSNYVNASNNYSTGLPAMYSSKARIVRQIIKPNGELANAYFSMDDYKHQMKLSAKIAKIRNYKNYYSNITATKVSDGYKISALRKPSLSDYKLKMYMVVEKQNDGRWLIVEEMMQTKEQVFLKYVR